MRFRCIAIVLGAFAGGLPAATVDVSAQTTQQLESGDSLVFLFTDSSYSQRASTMSLAPYPSQIFFNFVSAPAGLSGQFTVGLESADGSASYVSPQPVVWTSGDVETSDYSGPASVLVDSLTLSSTLSQQIFAASAAELILTYTGPDFTVGLPGSSLKHDLTISLAGGPLTIGAMNYGVTLDEGLDAPSAAPEPGSAALIFGAGILLCTISLVLKHFGRSREPVCNPIEVSDTIGLDTSESLPLKYRKSNQRS